MEKESISRTSYYFSNSTNRKLYTGIVIAIVFIAFYAITQLVFPPKDVKLAIDANPKEFLQFSEGVIFFGENPTSNLSDSRTRHKISLPDRSISKLKDYDQKNIWYEFKVNVPEESYLNFKTAVLIPSIWGKSRVYLNGELRDLGTNSGRSIFPLAQKENILLVQADTTGFSKREPIRATYPLVVGDIDKLRELSQTILDQAQSWPRAFSSYCLAIILFGVLFLAYPKKPELLAFVLFLASSLTHSILYWEVDALNGSLFGSQIASTLIPIASEAFSKIFLFAFSLLFFRAHPKQVLADVTYAAAAMILLGGAIFSFINKAIPSMAAAETALLSLNLVCLFLHLTLAGPRLAYIATRKNIPLARKIACSLTFFSISFLYGLNIFDYFFYFKGVTSPQLNALVLNFSLSVTTAYEVARAEINQFVFGSMLPREVKEGINLDQKGVDQKGFVILVDAVGYASNRQRFDSSSEMSSYIKILANRMLSPLCCPGSCDRVRAII